MTSAPSNLLAVRSLLLTHLNVDKGTVRSADLEPAEVGIVGDSNHRGGYHCGRDRVVTNDYSVVESPRDREGLSDYASALDVGLFEVRSGGRTHTLASFSVWCVNQCIANAPDTRDIREIIYSPDGKVVRRWDRLRKRTYGDITHLYHTHFSFFRDSRGRDQTPLFRRWLTTIGLLEDDMPLSDADQPVIKAAVHNTPIGRSGITFGEAMDDLRFVRQELQGTYQELVSLRTKVEALAAVPPGTVVIPDDQLERVLRKVIGSVDEATPQA